MSTIRQMYCTHCTHGTSALERREGELAQRIFGYTVRAGSQEAGELRKTYRQVEPYIYYYLPRDTPSEEKLRLSAGTAPRRLFFTPSAGGLQLVGQVCYRQTDSEGRPGSYFAHLLFQEEKTPKPAGPRSIASASGMRRAGCGKTPRRSLFSCRPWDRSARCTGNRRGLAMRSCCDF